MDSRNKSNENDSKAATWLNCRMIREMSVLSPAKAINRSHWNTSEDLNHIQCEFSLLKISQRNVQIQWSQIKKKTFLRLSISYSLQIDCIFIGRRDRTGRYEASQSNNKMQYKFSYFDFRTGSFLVDWCLAVWGSQRSNERWAFGLEGVATIKPKRLWHRRMSMNINNWQHPPSSQQQQQWSKINESNYVKMLKCRTIKVAFCTLYFIFQLCNLTAKP